ncbi:MAG: hypothetical protein OQL18_01120, partial [Deltaproteobacteria bacterium]|nr:hypothetical protein [Deltaproteobacteria bacterium]
MKTYKPAVFFVVLMGLSILLSACSNEGSTGTESAVKRKKVVPVEVEQVTTSNLVETFTLPAGLEAWEDLILAAEIAGPVYKINFQEGDKVKKRDILVEIDPDTVKSYLRRDQENVAVIQRKLNRYRHLEKEGLVSKQELDDLQNSLIAAEAVLRTTELQLEKSFPQAPVSGTVDHL